MISAPHLTVLPSEPALQEAGPIDPSIILDFFWEQNEAFLRDRIRAVPYYQNLFEMKKREHPTLTPELFETAFFEHERAFVNHVLIRLTTILNNAEAEHQLGDRGIVFNIHTSLLCDVDETIGGGLGQMMFGIRPAAVLLLCFIRDELPNVRIGLVTTRDQKNLNRQLVDPEARGSLTEVAEFITGESVGVYNVSGGFGVPQVVNKEAFDTRMYPGWQPEGDVQYVLMAKLGFSAEAAANFERDEWAVFWEAAMRSEILSSPQISIQNEVEDGVYDIFLSNRDLEYGLCEQVQPKILVEILMQTERLAQIIDEGSDKEALIPALAGEVMARALEDIPENKRPLFRGVIEKGLQKSYEYIVNIRERSAWLCEIPAEITGRNEMLRYVAEDLLRREVEDRGRAGFISRYCYDPSAPNDNAYYRLQNRFLLQEGGPQIMQPNFQTNFRRATYEIYRENKQHLENFDKHVTDLLGLEEDHLNRNLFYVKTAIQRLAACRRQLDEGAASVAVAVDDKKVAERFDQLFQGNIMGPDGRPVDGYALFGLPDEYRGRLFMIHVGENAEFSTEAFTQRIMDLLAA